jgi:hypothetical protein
MDDNKKLQEEWVRRVTWRALPRTVGMISGASFLALLSALINSPNDSRVAETPNLAIAIYFFAWFVMYLIRELFPIGTVRNNIIWNFFGWLIILISTPIIKTVGYFVLVDIALWNGSSLILTLIYFGGLWLFDQLNRTKQLPTG